ncbi:MAG TPA: methyltransferase domain-containing protein [Rhodanobacteraceae bacterium]|nr:methyltransferase domain-containing protein [Rhodanobacteraceae bacterium]
MNRAAPSLFALPEVETLLREELGHLPAHAARQPSGRALLLQPDAAAHALPIETGPLTALRLHARGDALAGDLVCSARALPVENEAFQLVFAQHIGDVQPGNSGLVEEIARVLAPGGLLLWSGFNPWSPWLAWVHWHTRGGGAVPQTLNVDTLRRRLIRSKLAPLAIDYLGGCWPRQGAVLDDDAPPSGFARFISPLRGAYLLAARKQRAALTPLRPRAVRKSVALNPRLVGTPSQRACA